MATFFKLEDFNEDVKQLLQMNFMSCKRTGSHSFTFSFHNSKPSELVRYNGTEEIIEVPKKMCLRIVDNLDYVSFTFHLSSSKGNIIPVIIYPKNRLEEHKGKRMDDIFREIILQDLIK